MQWIQVVLLSIAAAFWTDGSTRAAGQSVDLELALGIDVSGSVDDEEAMLQRQGYIAAFRDPEIIHAIETGFLGRIAVAHSK